MIKKYLKDIHDIAKTGQAREESFYSTLKILLENYSESSGIEDVNIIINPKKTKAGYPDFKVWQSSKHRVGYIEAKSPTEINLEAIEETSQLKKYLNVFPNILLTNFLEFRLYRDGEILDKVLIVNPSEFHKLTRTPPVKNQREFFALIERFFSFSLPEVYDAEKLAIELAKRTTFLKDEIIIEEIKEEEGKGEKFILGFYEAFRKYLILGLTKEEFSDFYSQTITYGLFAARARSTDVFNRKLAYDLISPTIGILREVFRYISLEDLPKQMESIIDDIAEILAVTDVKKILHQYYRKGKGTDPIFHFYETFLSVYAPKERKHRGVYYTPESVVSYIVRSLHLILKDYFNKEDGFASDTVTVLDPAAGTLTFLAETAKTAVNEFVSKYGEGGKGEFVKSHILKNFYAFEIMMAPYTAGHIKMSFLLEELGYKLQEGDRFKFYLTNTLEMEKIAQTDLPGTATLSKESRFAGKVKKEQPILVILGNPPYSVSSANKSDFIRREMDLYKEDVRSERNIQPLSDDYIKFIRFSHWKIDKMNKGTVGIITNNSYLSGLIHRGMRKKILESFQKIYILNLHGNTRTNEKCPDGSKDENVFDIMQGVSIAIFIKIKNKNGLGKVFYNDVYGLRKNKYKYLEKNNIKSTNWVQIKPSEPYYFFVPKDLTEKHNYDKYIKVTDIFHDFSSGVKTHRDHFLVKFNKEEVKQKISTFISDLSEEQIISKLDLRDTRDWNINKARARIKKVDWQKSIIPYAYRPFDIRYICYQPDLIDRGCDRWDLMKNFFKRNLALVTIRSESKDVNYSHTFISKFVVDIHYCGGQTYVFPLLIYPDETKKGLFPKKGKGQEIELNIKEHTLNNISKIYNKNLRPEEFLYYIYTILNSNVYRNKYSEFLKFDFPKIPIIENYNLFKILAGLGYRLVTIHLLESKELDPPTAKFQRSGNNKIDNLKYEEKQKRLYINSQQYIEGISKDLWEYEIGGYQVCHKWIKDRKSRILSLDDIKHYCKVVTAVKKSIAIQKEIDRLYTEAEKYIIEFPED